MKVKFTDLGRSHFNGEYEIKKSSDIPILASKHLMSQEIEAVWENEAEGVIVVGGWRKVGKFEVIM
jgi:hypothetical protein